MPTCGCPRPSSPDLLEAFPGYSSFAREFIAPNQLEKIHPLFERGQDESCPDEVSVNVSMSVRRNKDISHCDARLHGLLMVGF